MSEPFDLIVENGTVVDGSGAEGFAAAVGVRDGRLSLVFGETEETTPAARRIDATGPGREPRVHRPPQPLRPDDLRRPAARAEGAAGRHHRGHRRRRAQLRADPRPERPRGAGPHECRPRRRAPEATSPTTGARSRPTSTVSTPCSHRSTSHSSSATARCGCPPSAGTRSRPPRPRSRTCARCCERRWRRAPSVSRRAWTIRPAPTPAPMSWPRSPARRRPTAASTTPTSATRSAIGTWIPFREAIEIGRRGEGPAHITHFYHRQTFPGGSGPMLALVDDARAEGLDVTFDTYPYEWASTRLLIMIPPWVQAGGPMPTKERLAEPSCATTFGESCPSAACSMRAATPGTTSGSARSRGRSCCAARAAPSASSCATGTAIPSTSSATCCSRRTCASTRSRRGRGPRRCATSSAIRSG